MQPIISQDAYEIRLVQHLLSNRFLRTSNGKLVTSRSISEETYGFETEDSICAKRPPSNLMIKDRHKLRPIPLIYYELSAFDPELKVYELHHDTKDYVEVPILEAVEYAVLLGITFKDIWYTCDTPYAIAHNRALLDLYFNQGHNVTLFGKYSKAIAVNPFQRLVYLQRGRAEHFQWDVEDPRSQQRLLPYREVRRFHENMRTRPVSFEDAPQPIQI